MTALRGLARRLLIKGTAPRAIRHVPVASGREFEKTSQFLAYLFGD